MLCAGLKRLVEDEGLTMSDIVGVGCGAPNANFYSGCIEQAPNLPWKGVVPFAKLISERMGVKCTITNDAKSSWFWAFMLGIFFAIAFCPHRLIYFFTMIDTAITLSPPMNWILPIVFGLGTGLPILILAWVICYSAVNTQVLTAKVKNFEKWFRYVCAALFLGYGIYLGIHIFMHPHVCC